MSDDYYEGSPEAEAKIEKARKELFKKLSELVEKDLKSRLKQIYNPNMKPGGKIETDPKKMVS